MSVQINISIKTHVYNIFDSVFSMQSHCQGGMYKFHCILYFLGIIWLC